MRIESFLFLTLVASRPLDPIPTVNTALPDSCFSNDLLTLTLDGDFVNQVESKDLDEVIKKGSSGGGSSGGSSSGGGSSGGGRGGGSSGGGSSGGSSGGRGGGSSGGRGSGSGSGSSGGRDSSSSGGSRGKGGGKKGGKNGDHSTDSEPPPPYTPRGKDGPPPPYHPGTYGNRGTYPNHWNGQYYPYSAYGYRSVVPVAAASSPYFFAGAYGFYGPYGGLASDADGSSLKRENATVKNLYVNGTRLANGTWVDGTLIACSYQGDGVYTVATMSCSYHFGIQIGDDIAVNGSEFNVREMGSSTVNVYTSKTANGTILKAPASDDSNDVRWAWTLVALAVVALVL